ncbi:unnamed protein product [Calypogeia fissa]
MSAMKELREAESWQYRGEGAANIVLAYRGDDQELPEKVLRLRKCLNNDKSVGNAIKRAPVLTREEQTVWAEWPESVFRFPPSTTGSSVDTLQSNFRITFMPVVQELTKLHIPIDVRDSSTTSKEEESQRSSSFVEDLGEEDRLKNSATLKCKLSSNSTYTGKTSKILRTKGSHSSRRCASKRGERDTAPKDVSVFESPSDNDDLSYEEEVQVVSEKRRKRMLSNRASAQRSRQRRQERLDTLEVLVAELRVENAALIRKANLASLAAKASEKENKVLRDRLGKQEPHRCSDPSNESDKTTENSDKAANNNNSKNGGTAARPYGASVEPSRNGSSSAHTGAHTGENRYHHIHPRDSSLPSKPYRDNDDGAGVAENSKPWTNTSSSSSSFVLRFNSDPMEGVTAPDFCGGGGTFNRAAAGVLEGSVNGKDLYQSAVTNMTNMTQPQSFQNLDAFGIELEQCNQEMDKKSLDSRSMEDIWLDSLANCLK